MDSATEDYRIAQGKLNTAYEAAGYSAETAATAYNEFYQILGDTDTATEASQLLSKLVQNEQDVTKWTRVAAGVSGTFGDSLPIEGLIVLNEVGRRTKLGAAIIFGVAPLAMTIYCVAIAIGVSQGAEWALTNPTHIYQNSWFHYAKVYAALAGCWGFIAIKYQWGKIGKAHWFRAWPFVIVAINIMIAVVSDFESAYHFFVLGQSTWVTSEGATQLAGWNNVFNGIAGIINIFCMTGWWSVYASEDKTDMLWPDMTWVYIIAYDIWNFCYTYNCLPTHSWFCGFALLLAPTVAAFIWNKGGWIQNRAFTLAIWCMFAQVFPYFQEESIFVTHSTLDPGAATAVSIAALVANIAAIIYIAYRAKKLGRNPYKQDVFEGTSDWEKATARRAKVDYAHAE